MAGAETTKSIIKVYFELYVRTVECVGVTWIDLNVNATIREVKSNLLEGITSSGPLTLMFDSLLLEDGATLVGLGVVDGDTVYVSDNGVESFRGIEMNSRIAEEISVGLNVLLGEAEHGFDVIPEDEEKEKESLSIPGCCATCIYCIRELYLFKDRFNQAFLNNPHLVKNLPNFADFITHCDTEKNHENCDCDNWEYYENCVFDCYEDRLDSFINNLPEGSNTLDYCKVMLELFPQDKNVKTMRKCPRDIHTNCTDPVGFYIGPTRNSNFSNYLAFPPTILMKVGKISDKTTLQDLVYSYQLYSEQRILTSFLNYSNERFDLTKTVFEVINSNAFLNNHYFSFPYDISKSEDTRCIDDLVEFIQGDGDAGTERKKKKKRRKKSSNQTLNTSSASIHDSKSPNNVGQGDEIFIVKGEVNRENTGDNDAIQSSESYKAFPQYETLGAIPRRNNNFETNQRHGRAPKANISSFNEVQDDSNHTMHDSLEKKRKELERRVAEEREHLLTHKQNVEDLIDKKAVEMKNLILLIDKSRDEKNRKMKGVAQIEKDLSELELRMKELNLEKRDLLGACDREDEKLQKYECKRLKLEEYIENELKKNKEREIDIEVTIQDLETKLNDMKNSRDNHQNQVSTNRPQPVELNKELLDFIDNQISEKEKELECPVCLEVAESPIFMCSELHLICCNCRPKVKACPECRIEYEGKPKRHRYAEKTAEELVRIKKQREQVIKLSASN